MKPLVFSLLGLLLTSCNSMGLGSMYGPGWMHGWGGHFFGGYFMWIIIILVVAVIIFLFYRTNSSGRNGISARKEGPKEILERRYANGEITKEQFEEMKRDLDI